MPNSNNNYSIEIISDATVEPNLGGIGAFVCRIKKDTNNFDILFKEICSYEASQSFESELNCGIYAINKINNYILNNRFSLNYLTWYCDIGHLEVLVKNPENANNIILKELLHKVKKITANYNFKALYPTGKTIERLHHGCHRICSETLSRARLRNDKTKIFEVCTEVCLDYPKWSYYNLKN